MVSGHPRSEGEKVVGSLDGYDVVRKPDYGRSSRVCTRQTCGVSGPPATRRSFAGCNERVEEVNKAFESILGGSDFFCECADVDCMEKIRMTLREYEAVRDVSTHFAVKPGHVLPENERVVEERVGYVVVEKTGRAGERAADLDPRESGRAKPALASRR